MATLTFTQDTRSNSTKPCKIRLRIAHKQRYSYVDSNVSVEPVYFTGDIHQPISPLAPNHESSGELIAMYAKYMHTIEELKRSGKIDYMSANEIREYQQCLDAEDANEIRERNRKDKIRSMTFSQFYGMYLDRLLEENTRASYRYVFGVLSRFCKDTSRVVNIKFIDIDYAFLKELLIWMERNGLGTSAKKKVFAYMGAVYREACRYKVRGASKLDNPFDDIKIPKQEIGEIVVLSQAGLKKMLELDLTQLPGVKSLTMARDILMACIYLCGINLLDMYELPYTDGDEIVYVRSKIENKKPRPVHIKIVPELRAIINKYKGTDRLFNFHENTPHYKTFQRRVTERLTVLSSLVGEDLRMAYARHTWATYAYECGADKFCVDKSIGHKDKDTSEVNYIRYDWGMTDAINAKVIARIWDGVKPNSVPTGRYIRK